MPNIKELRQRQADLKAEGRELLDNIKTEGREASNEEESRLQEIETTLETVAADISKEEKRIERERAMSVEGSGHVSGGERVIDKSETAGFTDIAEFATCVKEAGGPGGTRDDRLNAMYRSAPTNFHREGGSSDGYMVPPAFRQEIWELVFNEDDMLNAVDMEPTSSNQVDMLADESTPWGASGVQANWRSEGAKMDPSRLSTEGRTVKLNELYAFVLASEELLQDAPRLGNRLTRKAAEAIRWKASDAILYGTGSGQPLGYMNSGALVSIAKEGAQNADTIVAENILKMYSRLLTVPGSQPFWLANRDTVPQLSTITIGDKPAWLPPNGLMNAPGGFLMGYPVRWSEHAKTLGDKGDLQLLDPMGYYAVNKQGGVSFNSSIHLYFDYGIEAFRWTFRFGGQPYLSAPVSPANGNSTKSHFVVLDERA
ncbi:phage major capsid protein [Algiphilus sp.]|uniref:phage major capsid protein n=1 Tax=Algiphilus sp. TaxID=1872431 RepID=UPI003CCBDB67